MFIVLCEDYEDAESTFLDVSLFIIECIPEEEIFIEKSALLISIPKIKVSITFCDCRASKCFKNVKDKFFISREDIYMIQEIISESIWNGDI